MVPSLSCNTGVPATCRHSYGAEGCALRGAPSRDRRAVSSYGSLARRIQHVDTFGALGRRMPSPEAGGEKDGRELAATLSSVAPAQRATAAATWSRWASTIDSP
ncbi:MAG: hypothetical protein NVSMB65_04750 [Chloroflexota bacterium]